MQGLIGEDIRDFWAHYRIVKSIGDGHCILHSLATCLNYYYVKEFSVSWLLEKMKHECTINYNRYIPFMDGDINYFYNKMNGYVLYKEYDSSFCDLMPYIMANALKEQIVILESTDCFHALNAIPQVESVSKLTKITSLSHLYHVIVLYKEGYHYDACVRMNSRDV